MKWQIERVFRNSYNASISFKNIELKSGKIHFLGCDIQKNEETFASFNAVLSPRLNLSKREFGGKLKLENLKLVQKKLKKPLFPELHASQNSFFCLNLKTSISQGELFLYDAPSVFQHVFFDLEHNLSSSNAYGELSFYTDPLFPKLSSLFFKAHANKLEISGDFSSDSFPKIYGLSTYFFAPGSSFQNWKFVSGQLNGNVNLKLENGHPTHLKADVFLSNVEGENPELEILAQLDRLHASIDTDFSKITGINGEFLVQGGKLALQDKPNVCVGFWDLNDLNSKISIKKGKLENSVLHANFLGLQGQFVLDMDSEDLIHMDFHGMSNEMYSFFPTGLQKGFQKAFPNDFIELVLKVKKAASGLELVGFLTTLDEEEKKSHIDFGCALGHVDKKGEDIGLYPLPLSLSDSMSLFLEHVKAQFCLTSKRLGWFRAKEIALSKFLSPFLFKDINMHLSAEVDIDATFDERYLVLFYEGKNFHLESPHFELNAESVQKKEEYISAVHCIDLENFSHVGFLPLKKASYFQKNYNVLIENTEALLQFENDTIKVRQIKTDWKDLKLEGNLDIQINSFEDIDLDIISDNFVGSSQDACALVSHFVPLKIWKIPFEKGEVEGFFHFKFHFSPRAELKEGTIRGKMKDCVCGQEFYQFTENNADFEYDFSKNTLLFNDCTGKILLPSKNKVFSYSMPKVLFRDFPYFQSDFSLVLSENGKEILSLNGESHEKKEGREICVLGDSCALTAYQVGNFLKIEDFTFREMQGRGDFKLLSKTLEIDHLSFKKNAEREVIFSGKLDLGTMQLIGNLEKIELDLHETFKKAQFFQPMGQLTARGFLDWQFGKNLQIEALVSYIDLELGKIPFGSGGNLKCTYSTECGLEVEGLELEIPTKEEFHKCNLGKIFYDFEENKLKLEGFDFSFSKEKLEAFVNTVEMVCPEKLPHSLLDILKSAKKENQPIEGKISIEIYPENLWVYLYLKDGTYLFLDKKIELKNFSLIYDPFQINAWTKCRYKEANCWLHFSADSVNLSQGMLAICDHELSKEKPASIDDSLMVKWERCPRRGFKIQHVEGRFSGLDVAIKAVDRNEDPNWMFLKGRMDCELEKIHSFLWGYVKKFISTYSLKGFYHLDGEIGFDKKNKEASLTGMLSGKEVSCVDIKMSDFSSLVSYQKDYLSFTNFALQDVGGQLTIAQLNLNQAGNDWEIAVEDAKLKDLRLSKVRSSWLKMDQRRKSFFRFLFIPRATLTHLTGILGKKESFKGEGRLEFTNLPKKTLFSSLLFLPTEITARIGLDFSNLVPVRGTIIYDVRDSKVHFLELKDTFSEGKRSRFYLADQTPAWVDFSGNLNMKIKMKQYNLLMKLAEFFTISVKGTLFRPTYTFSNHLDDEESI